MLVALLTNLVAVLAAPSGRPTEIEVPSVVPRCPADIDQYRDWIAPRLWPSGQAGRLPKSVVRTVTADYRKAAVNWLDHTEWVELSVQDVSRFTGSPLPTGSSLKPYLIRNVVPNIIGAYGGPVWIERAQSSLRIRAGLFGCGGFYKNPIVVLLPVAPDRVDMDVSAIW